MKIIKEAIQRMSKTVVSKMVEKDSGEWPPSCSSFVYQAKRPQQMHYPLGKENKTKW